MKDSAKFGGMVICLDVSRDTDAAARYIDGFDYGKLNLLGIEQKLRRGSLDKTGKDFEIGLKLPVYMHRIGLQNIDIRMNDFVQFLRPEQSSYDEQCQSFISGQYERIQPDEQKEKSIKMYMDRGATAQEAENEFAGQQKLTANIHAHKDSLSAVSSKCMLISYGYVKGIEFL